MSYIYFAAALILFITFILCLIKFMDFLRPTVTAEGKGIFITGCDTGIGFESALLMDSLGFTVFAGCLDPLGPGAEQLKKKASQKLHIVGLDVTDQKSIDDAKETIDKICSEDETINLWCIINNAGVFVGGDLEWLTWGHVERQLNVNLMGPLRVIKTFLPTLRKSKGRIINISSVNGRWTLPSMSIYCAAKFGLEGMSACLRSELRRHGVKVIVIAPGDFVRLTNIMASQAQHAREQWDAMSEELRKRDAVHFRETQKGMTNLGGAFSPKNFQESPLLNDIRQAVMDSRPSYHYTSAAWPYRLSLFFLRNLPPQLEDLMVDFGRNVILKHDLTFGKKTE